MLFCHTGYSQTTISETVEYMRQKGFSLASNDYFTLNYRQEKYLTRKFYSSSTYCIVALPTETGVKDLDIYVYEADGTLYKKDADASKVSVVNLDLLVSREMSVYVKNYDCERTGYGYDCRLLIFYK